MWGSSFPHIPFISLTCHISIFKARFLLLSCRRIPASQHLQLSSPSLVPLRPLSRRPRSKSPWSRCQSMLTRWVSRRETSLKSVENANIPPPFSRRTWAGSPASAIGVAASPSRPRPLITFPGTAAASFGNIPPFSATNRHIRALRPRFPPSSG